LLGEEVIRDGRAFTLVEDTSGTSVFEEAGGDTRIEVMSSSLDSETLLRIAESVSFDRTKTSSADHQIPSRNKHSAECSGPAPRRTCVPALVGHGP
jgi:hypothetical protein